MLVALETGGTKIVYGRGDGVAASLVCETVPTLDPDSTIAHVEELIERDIAALGPIDAIGIASFGPLDLDRASPAYGRITTTPKPGWSGFDVPGRLAARFGVPVAIDTDVNAAALAEARLWDSRDLAYVTVGTGIGVGVVVDGAARSGYGHPEGGHLTVRRHPAHAEFAGVCPYHGDCLEGLASGPALAAFWGGTASQLPPEHPAWAAEADYLGQLCAIIILTLAPERIVFGGGVMQQQHILPRIRLETAQRLAGYCANWTSANLTERIVRARSTEPAGLSGAYLLAQGALDGKARLASAITPPSFR